MKPIIGWVREPIKPGSEAACPACLQWSRSGFMVFQPINFKLPVASDLISKDSWLCNKCKAVCPEGSSEIIGWLKTPRSSHLEPLH